ncbi:hypothetical protein DOY81_002745 [Sarcophaga bullata]|nr:hypothetical protein DOY81_002745 [Sarcophaga bullata]
MTRLTEEMVIARSKQSDLSSIKKLNCWGSDLSDVSIIKRMRGVEVLALSVNKINTLQPFEDCLKLQELYLRKNNIQDINEIAYLQNLPNLKYLWLEENPCCDRAGTNYRAIVLRALPNLKKLDNVEPPQRTSPATTEDSVSETNQANGSSKASTPSQEQLYSPSPKYNSTPKENRLSYHQYDRSPDTDQESPHGGGFRVPIPPSASTHSMKEYYQSDRPAYPAHYRHSQTDLTEWDDNQPHQHHSNHNPYGSTAALHHMGQRRSAGTERTEPVDRYAYRNGRENGDWDDERPRPRRPDGRYADSASTVSTASSNLLSATLCLVKELDYPSLEVVEHAVRCRIDELSAE